MLVLIPRRDLPFGLVVRPFLNRDLVHLDDFLHVQSSPNLWIAGVILAPFRISVQGIWVVYLERSTCGGASSFFLMISVRLNFFSRILGTSDEIVAGVERITSRYHGRSDGWRSL